jgi:hypothetical protein
MPRGALHRLVEHGPDQARFAAGEARQCGVLEQQLAPIRAVEIALRELGRDQRQAITPPLLRDEQTTKRPARRAQARLERDRLAILLLGRWQIGPVPLGKLAQLHAQQCVARSVVR